MQSENVGKKITRISISKKKVTIYLNKEKLSLSYDVFTSHYLFVGKELTNKELKEIKKESDVSEALEYSKSLLLKSQLTEWKLRDKLYQKEYTKETIDLVINKLKKIKLIDDTRYMKEYVEYCNEKLYGKNKIIQKLKSIGMFDETIQKMNFSDTKEKEKAKKLLPKMEKKYKDLSLVDKKQHIVNAYIAQGYSMDIAISMMNYVKTPSRKVEEDTLKKSFNLAYLTAKRKYDDEDKIREVILNKLMSKGFRYKDIDELWRKKNV